MRTCCFCDRPIAPRFDFCKDCKETNDALFGPGWTESDWHQETVKMSRHLDHVIRKHDDRVGLQSIDALDISDHTVMTLVQPRPTLADVLTDLLVAALIVTPDAGWRRMYRIIQEQGVPATERQVRYRLEQIRAEVGQHHTLEVGG